MSAVLSNLLSCPSSKGDNYLVNSHTLTNIKSKFKSSHMWDLSDTESTFTSIRFNIPYLNFFAVIRWIDMHKNS